MTALAFDTLVFANKLKNAGLDSKIAEAQAEATAEIFQDLMLNQLATKTDIKELKVEIKELENSTNNNLKELKNSTRNDMKELEMRLYAFMSKVALFTVTILGSLQAILHFIK